MNTQKSVTATVENIKGETIQIRQCSEPTEQVKNICSRLKFNMIPLARKKSVWHTGELPKTEKIRLSIRYGWIAAMWVK